MRAMSLTGIWDMASADAHERQAIRFALQCGRNPEREASAPV